MIDLDEFADAPSGSIGYRERLSFACLGFGSVVDVQPRSAILELSHALKTILMHSVEVGT